MVHLALPAGGPCATLARTAVVALGRQSGFGRTTLGALAHAIDEALVLVLPTTDEGVDLEVVVRPGALRVSVAGRRPRVGLEPVAVTRFAEVVSDLVASVDVDGDAVVVRLEVGDAVPPASTA